MFAIWTHREELKHGEELVNAIIVLKHITSCAEGDEPR